MKKSIVLILALVFITNFSCTKTALINNQTSISSSTVSNFDSTGKKKGVCEGCSHQ